MAKPAMLVFGDSICAGSNLPDGGAQDAWPHVWERLPGATWRVVNHSRGGRPTDSLPEFHAALGRAETDGPFAGLMLAVGANDARDLTPGMVDRAVANLGTMVDLAQAAGIPRIIIVGPYNLNREKLGATYPIRHERDANLRALEAAYVLFAATRALSFIAMYGVISEAHLTHDGVHPDRAGNVLIAEHVARHLA
jgi:lysophospholipase L1-like esterase